jgi:hypothetical protein
MSFRKLEKQEVSEMSDDDLKDELFGTNNLLDTCDKVAENCALNDEESKEFQAIQRVLRQDYNLLIREQNLRL